MRGTCVSQLCSVTHSHAVYRAKPLEICGRSYDDNFMQIEQIRARIEEGKDIERQTGSLRRAVVSLARRDRVRAAELDVAKIVAFVTDYIEHAPVLMTAIEEAAARNGTQADVQPILDATSYYFLASDDIIPDRYGLVGLLDDAYLTHILMEEISDRYKLRFGRSLLPIEAHGLNTFIRRLIGVPFINILDEHLAATMESLSVESDVNRIMAALEQIDLVSAPGPLWGKLNASDVSLLRIVATGGR